MAGLLMLASLSSFDLLNTMAFSHDISAARAAASAGAQGNVLTWFGTPLFGGAGAANLRTIYVQHVSCEVCLYS